MESNEPRVIMGKGGGGGGEGILHQNNCPTSA